MSPRCTLALAVVAALAGAGPAEAGAWPREPGGVFLSLRSDFGGSGRGRRATTALYGEYGLTARVTLGGQIAESADRATPPRAGAFARYALTGDDARHRFAVSLGASAPADRAGMAARLEAGLHWGRGFASRAGPGWATMSGRLLFDRDEDRPVTDLHALVGLRPAAGWMTMLSVSRYADDGGSYVKISPAVGYALRDDVWIVPNLTRELGDDRATTVGVSLWLSF